MAPPKLSWVATSTKTAKKAVILIRLSTHFVLLDS